VFRIGKRWHHNRGGEDGQRFRVLNTKRFPEQLSDTSHDAMLLALSVGGVDAVAAVKSIQTAKMEETPNATHAPLSLVLRFCAWKDPRSKAGVHVKI